MKKNHPNTKKVIKRFKQFLLKYGLLDEFVVELKSMEYLTPLVCSPERLTWDGFAWTNSQAGYYFWQGVHMIWMQVCREESWRDLSYDWH